jgi:hypothetical protein
LNLAAFLYPITGRIFTNFETKSENNAKKIDYWSPSFFLADLREYIKKY